MKIPEIVNKLTGTDVEKTIGHLVRCSFFNCVPSDHDYAANCWNATLLFHGVVKEPKYCDKKTMRKWLQENTKKIRKENRKLGDIIVLWDQDELIHTAVIIHKNKIWQKPSFLPDHTWEYNSLNSLAIYRATKTEFRRVIK